MTTELDNQPCPIMADDSPPPHRTWHLAADRDRQEMSGAALRGAFNQDLANLTDLGLKPFP